MLPAMPAGGLAVMAGTEADCVGGVARYSSWYEMYPHRSFAAPVAAFVLNDLFFNDYGQAYSKDQLQACADQQNPARRDVQPSKYDQSVKKTTTTTTTTLPSSVVTTTTRPPTTTATTGPVVTVPATAPNLPPLVCPAPP